MNDLPSQTALQQRHARNISGEELEVMGKKAAAQYTCGSCSTLNEAVVETVKHAGYSPEQVRRVIEFANVSAYLEQFNKLGSDHKYVDFQGGPASPSEVLKDLNDGGGGTVFDRGDADYHQPPMHKSASETYAANRACMGLEKTASVLPNRAEEAFTALWATEDKPEPYADPWRDIADMREKLADTRDSLVSELNSLEVDYEDATAQLYHQVKQASLEGVPLGHVVQAWQDTCPEAGYVKEAFALIAPKLVEEGVLTNDGIGASLTKTASRFSAVNPEHPLLGTFVHYCDALTKMAAMYGAILEVEDAHEKAEYFLTTGLQKTADGRIEEITGLVPKAWHGANRLADRAAGPVADALGGVSGAILGKGVGRAVRTGAHAVTRNAPTIAALVGTKELYDQAKYHPGVQEAKETILARIPYTSANQRREWYLQGGVQ